MQHKRMWPEKRNTQIYFYASFNPFPAFNKVLKETLKGDDTFCNKDIHIDIKSYYETVLNRDMKTFYTKYSNNNS